MFCPKCGKKNKDSAKFCEFCGTEIKEEEKIILPKAPRKKLNKKNLIIIIVISIIAIILIGGGLILSNQFKPANVAVNYFKAVMDADSDKIYDYISFPKSEFTTKDIFEKMIHDEESGLDLMNYQVISQDISSDGLSAQVEISYILEGRQTPLTQTIYLVKNKKNKFLIFPNWKISEGSSLVEENYEIEVLKGVGLKLDGIEVGKKYLKNSKNKQYDVYEIPSLFKGIYDAEITLKNGLILDGKLDVSSTKSLMNDIELKDKDEKELLKTLSDDIKTLYESAIGDKSFDDMNFEDGDLKQSYDKFRETISDSHLQKIDFKDINIEEIEVLENGYLKVTVDADYQYTADGYLSDDDIDGSGDDIMYLTYDYKDGFKLKDFSSLVSLFSRF